jgi:tripartite-type tricarboxylate transporter receptor subunit TctC
VLAVETYPARSVRLVVPFPPGGGNDAMVRIVAEKLGATLRQRVVVEHKGGAGGAAGTADVIKSAPNGYTLLLTDTASVAMAPHLYRSASYDPRRDLAPVGLIGRTALVMVVHVQAPLKAMKHVIDLARIAPGTLNYGSAGSGSESHLSAALFVSMSATRLTHVPYQGNAQALANLLARQVDVVFSALSPVRGYIESDTLRALAITSPERLPALPGVPTVAEAGLPGFEVVLNYGLAGPARTPAATVRKLNGRLNTLFRVRDVANLFATDGITAQPGSPDQYQSVIAGDYEKWGEVIRKTGARVE